MSIINQWNKQMDHPVDIMLRRERHGRQGNEAASEMNCEAGWGWTILLFLGMILLIACFL